MVAACKVMVCSLLNELLEGRMQLISRGLSGALIAQLAAFSQAFHDGTLKEFHRFSNHVIIIVMIKSKRVGSSTTIQGSLISARL